MRSEGFSPAEPSAGPRRWPLWLAAGLTLALLAAAGAALWSSGVFTRPAVPAIARNPYDDNPDAREIYSTARFEVSERTAESLAAAERGFRQLVERYPERAAGWSGLADTYLLLREFGSMSDEVAYPQAARAARTGAHSDQPQAATGRLSVAGLGRQPAPIVLDR